MITKKPYFTVIIVAFNSGKYLEECINSLKEQSFKDFEIIIFDNGTTDGSIERIDLSHINIKFIKSSFNEGFAIGNNKAAREANGDWLVLLNADAIPQSDWLSKINIAIHKYPKVAIFGSTQVSYYYPDIIDGAGDHYHPFGVAWRGGEGYPVDSISDDLVVLGPCAAAAVYRKDIYQKLNGMAENFFCYYEDVDLALRFRLDGHLCIQLADARVKHVGSATFGIHSDFARYHVNRNKIWTFIRCIPGPLLVLLFPGFLTVILSRLCMSVLSGDFKLRYRALCDAIIGLPEAWNQRRLIQRHRKISLVKFGAAMTWSFGKLLMRASDGRVVPETLQVHSTKQTDA